jgi:hypothetical protein
VRILLSWELLSAIIFSGAHRTVPGPPCLPHGLAQGPSSPASWRGLESTAQWRPPPRIAKLDSHIPTHHRNGLFQNQTVAKLEFATDSLAERGGFEQSVRRRVPDRGSGPL